MGNLVIEQVDDNNSNKQHYERWTQQTVQKNDDKNDASKVKISH